MVQVEGLRVTVDIRRQLGIIKLLLAQQAEVSAQDIKVGVLLVTREPHCLGIKADHGYHAYGDQHACLVLLYRLQMMLLK